MDGSVTDSHQQSPGSDEATWRDELAAVLGPTTFPCTSQDATVNLLRAHAPSRLLRRVSTTPPQLRFASLDSLIAYIDAHSQRRRPQHPVAFSRIDAKDRGDIALQQIIDDLARSSRGRPHSQAVSELAERIADQDLPAEPRPWLNAVADAAVSGNPYVVTAITAAVSEVPQLRTARTGEAIT